jgi:PAS domain S-box-containing protein
MDMLSRNVISSPVNLVWFQLDEFFNVIKLNRTGELLFFNGESNFDIKSLESFFTQYNIQIFKTRLQEIKEGLIENFSLPLELAKDKRKVILGIYVNDLEKEKKIVGGFQFEKKRKLFPESPPKLLVQLNNTKEAIAITNPRGEFFFVNKALIDVFGFSSTKELLGKSWSVLHFEEEANRIQNTINVQLSESGNYRGEVIGKKKDNSIVQLEISLTLLDNGDTLCLIKDISNKKTQEKELEQLGMVLEKTNSLVLMLNQSGKIVWANDGYYKNTGYSKEEVLGKNIQVLGFGEETNQITLNEINKSIESASPYRGELYLYNKSGEGSWMYLDITPLTNNIGELDKFIVIESDITTIKQAEKNILNSLEKERNLSNLKTQFINLASHEFRTPLASIQSSIDILDLSFSKIIQPKDALKLTFERHHKRITHEIRRMSDIMTNILVLGRLDAGKMVYHPKESDFLDFVNELIVEETYSSYSPRTVCHEIRGNPRKIEMDASMMRYIFKNLLSNAFKYSQNKADPTMIIRYFEESVVIEIKDYGIGIPEEDVPNLFTSFYRCSNVDDIPGTGLGLVIVKQLTEMHHGQVSLVSEIDKGSTFKLVFPYKQR